MKSTDALFDSFFSSDLPVESETGPVEDNEADGHEIPGVAEVEQEEESPKLIHMGFGLPVSDDGKKIAVVVIWNGARKSKGVLRVGVRNGHQQKAAPAEKIEVHAVGHIQFVMKAQFDKWPSLV